MIIIEDFNIETEIPFQQINNFSFQWQLNEHALITLSGILKAEKGSIYISKNHKNSKIKIMYRTDVLFHGLIKDTIANTNGGVFELEVKAVSSTTKLDRNNHNEMFQDTSITYSQMLRELISKESGELICTMGKHSIERPFLCYEETAWQFAKRMASHLNGYIAADVITGKAALWFGFRKGNQIDHHSLFCKQVEILKVGKSVYKDRISYQLEGRENYLLGDQLLVNGIWQTVYEKNAKLERGELIFSYMVSNEICLKVKPYNQESIIGLGLKGVVEKVKKEFVYVRLEMDGKRGQFPFPWYSETSNAIYCMPEKGTKVEIYFMGSDESESIAKCCTDTEETESEQKMLRLPENAKLVINSSEIEMEKESSFLLSDSRLNFSGSSNFQIVAVGNIKLKSKRIEISAPEAINYVTEI